MPFKKFISRAGDIAQQVNQEYQRAREAQKQHQQQQQQYQQQYGQPGQYGQPQQSSHAQYQQQQPSPPAWSPPPNQQYAQNQRSQPQQNTNPSYPQYQFTQQQQHDPYNLDQVNVQFATAQAEAERLSAQYNAQLEQATRQADAELARLNAEKDKAIRLAEQQIEADQRAAQKLQAQAETQLAADQREAERLQEQYMQEYQREMKSVDEAAERLRREQEEQVKQFQGLGIRDEEEKPPPMPPRPVSQVYYPPPPPRPTSYVPPVSSSSVASPSSPGVASPSIQVSPPGVEGQAQNVYYPPPPPRSPAGQPPTPSNMPSQGIYCPPPKSPSTSNMPPRAENLSAQQDQYYPPPHSPATSAGATSTGEVFIQQPDNPPPASQAPQSPAQPAFPPSPTQPQASTYHQPSPQVPQSPPQPTFPPPPAQAQPTYHQPSPQAPPPAQQWDQPSSETTRSESPVRRYRTPPPPKPHPCGITPLAECAEDPVLFEVDWFTHAAAPQFPVCSKCYVDKIYDTKYKDAFRPTKFDLDIPRKCMFGSKRMKDIFWPKVISSGSLSEMIEFMQKRQEIPNCKEDNMIEGESWYQSPEIPGSTFCKACYEDTLAASPFAAKFTPSTIQNGAYCDTIAWYVKRMFTTHSKTNNWTAFVEGVKMRVYCAPCTKMEPVAPDQRKWYLSSKGPDGLIICQACYYDFFYGTADTHTFKPTTPKMEHRICLMGLINIKIPATIAISKKNPDLFWNALQNVDKNEFCHPKGTKGATWYTLPNDPNEFGVCGGCIAGIVEVMGGTGYFVPKKGVSKDDTRQCCFNLAHGRFFGFWVKYIESLLKGGPKPLYDFADKYSGVPGCPKDQMRVGRNQKWWGWGVAMICEECYINVAQGTALEPQFANRGKFIEDWRTCDLYSPRMRGLYKEACDTGNLNDFLTFAQHRQQVYMQTKFRAQQLKDEQRMKMHQAKMAGMSGSFYKNLGWSHDAMVGHSYTVGNSSVGYGHANQWVAQGYGYDQQASALGREAMSGMYLVQIEELTRRWLEVA